MFQKSPSFLISIVHLNVKSSIFDFKIHYYFYLYCFHYLYRSYGRFVLVMTITMPDPPFNQHRCKCIPDIDKVYLDVPAEEGHMTEVMTHREKQ